MGYLGLTRVFELVKLDLLTVWNFFFIFGNNLYVGNVK